MDINGNDPTVSFPVWGSMKVKRNGEGVLVATAGSQTWSGHRSKRGTQIQGRGPKGKRKVSCCPCWSSSLGSSLTSRSPVLANFDALTDGFTVPGAAYQSVKHLGPNLLPCEPRLPVYL
jgi:hypothetical protein